MVPIKAHELESFEYLVSEPLKEPLNRAIIHAFRQHDFKRVYSELQDKLGRDKSLRDSIRVEKEDFCADPVEHICRLKFEVQVYDKMSGIFERIIENNRGSINKIVGDVQESGSFAYFANMTEINDGMRQMRENISVAEGLRELAQGVGNTIRCGIHADEKFFSGIASAARKIADERGIDLQTQFLRNRRIYGLVGSCADEVTLTALPEREDYISIHSIQEKRFKALDKLAEVDNGLRKPTQADWIVLNKVMEYRLKEAERVYH